MFYYDPETICGNQDDILWTALPHVLTSEAVLVRLSAVRAEVALGQPDVLLEESAPGRHVDVHLLRPRHLPLLPEDLALPSQLGLPCYQGIQELYL